MCVLGAWKSTVVAVVQLGGLEERSAGGVSRCGNLCAFGGLEERGGGLLRCGNLCAFWAPGRMHYVSVLRRLVCVLGAWKSAVVAVVRLGGLEESSAGGVLRCGNLCAFWGPRRTRWRFFFCGVETCVHFGGLEERSGV